MSLQGLLFVLTFAVGAAAWIYVLTRYDMSARKVIGILCLPLIPCAIGLTMSVLGYDFVLTRVA